MKSSELDKFLDNLGYAQDDIVHFRLLKPKDFDTKNPSHIELLPHVIYFDKKGKPQAKKICLSYNRLTNQVFVNYGSNNPILFDSSISAYLANQSALGMAVYVVVNPGGQSAKDISLARLVYYENDTNTIEQQLVKFDELSSKFGGGFAVQTKHSVHSYFRLSESISVDEFTDTQRRLIAYIEGSDSSIHDPSRVMRVPGYDHIQMVNNEVVRTPITLVRDWDGTFASWEKIDFELPCIDITPTKSKLSLTMNPAPTDNSKNPNLPNLSSFLSKDNRDYIINGVEIGRRNTTAKAVAMDLIGTVRQLEAMGIPYSGTAEELYDQYSAHCDTASPGELSGIWETTLKQSPSACLDQDKMVTNNNSFYARTFQGPIVGFGTSQAAKAPHNPNAYKSLLAEDLETLDDDNYKKNFLTIKDKNCWDKVKVSLPLEIVEIIEYFSNRTGIEKEVYALSYLAQASSLATNKYDVHVGPKWFEPLNIFYVIVGEPGVNKSSVVSLFGDFHDDLNDRYKMDFESAIKVYNNELAEFITRKKEYPDFDEDEPIKPILRKSSVGRATLAKFTEILESQDSHNNSGLMYTSDEITSLFGSMDSNGGSTEKSNLLAGFSGKSVTSDTKIDGSQGTSRARFCVTGTTQPSTWDKFITKHSDGDGLEERFLLSSINTKSVKDYDHMDVSVPPHESTEQMIKLATGFDSINGRRFIKISDSIRPALNQVEKWAGAERSDRAKYKSYVFRLSGILAVLSNPNAPEINFTDLESAWALVQYAIGCRKEILGVKNASLADQMVTKSIKLLEKSGELTVSKLGSAIHDLRGASTEDRVAILNKVVEIMGSKVNLELNKKGMPVVSLIGANVPDLAAIPDLKASNSVVPATFQKEVSVTPVAQASISKVDSIDTFEVESEGIPNMTTKEVSLEETLTLKYEAEIVQADQVQTDQVQTDQVQMIHVPSRLIPDTLHGHLSKDGFYVLIKSTPSTLKISMEGIKNPVNIPLPKTE